jgi:hypothetical protein
MKCLIKDKEKCESYIGKRPGLKLTPIMCFYFEKKILIMMKVKRWQVGGAQDKILQPV